MSQYITKLIPWAYGTGTISYLFCNAYLDAKDMVNKFKNGKIDDFDKKYHHIDSEFSAAQYGATKMLGMYLPLSFIWPLAMPYTIIPHIIAKKSE